MPRALSAWLCLWVVLLTGCAADPDAGVAELSGEQLLDRMIAFHDPGDAWSAARIALALEESRPDGRVRSTGIFIDQPASSVLIETQRDGSELALSVYGDEATVAVDGRSPTAEEVDALRLSEDQLLRLRNYYLYLYGLPMKLRDPGTLVDPAVETGTFRGRRALVLRVTYEPEVGGDTWLFYADPESYEMFGYRFYHDEAAGDGEYIELEGLEEVAGLKLPAKRTWYTNAEDELLGTDTIVQTSSL